MDSTLLDQIRLLCRDRAAYEHLKAILVQQERVHQLSWEERYEKLMSVQAPDGQASDIFSNIIAREKALAQLADAIQRSPSLELVLQIAVQVAQKLLQVDRVAIFRRYPDGRGEFATDAIAAGLDSLANMPERQLSLARHMIEATQDESAVQTVESISSSSLSSHIVTLLEQIGISSYAANKIYAGQLVWGNLVAFHGSEYHSWTESDRTSLSLVAAQIGIAISLTNLRQQSQELTDDLHTLQIELDNLQQTVAEIASGQTQMPVLSPIPPEMLLEDEQIISPPVQYLGEEEHDNNSVSEDEEANVNQVQQNLDENENLLDEGSREIDQVDQEIANNNEFTTSLEYLPLSQNGVPPLFLIADSHPSLVEIEDEDNDLAENNENIVTDEVELEISQKEISNSGLSPEEVSDMEVSASLLTETAIALPELIDIESDQTKLIESESSESEIEVLDSSLDDSETLEAVTSDATEPNQSEIVLVVTEPEVLESLVVEPEVLEVETSDTTEPSQNEIISELSEPEVIDSQLSEVATDEIHDSQLDEPVISDLLTLGDTLEKFESEINEVQAVALPEYQLQESTADNPVVIHLPEPEITESEIKQTEDPQTDLKTLQAEIAEDDRDPAIEPQFIETILAIAGHDIKGINFLLGVIDSYLEDTPRLVQAIDKAIAVNDHAKILQALSSLRSSSDYVGALALSYQCRQLESAVKANYVVLIYACLSQVAIEAQRATDTLRIERARYAL